MTFISSTLDVMIASLVSLFRMYCVSVYVCMCACVSYQGAEHCARSCAGCAFFCLPPEGVLLWADVAIGRRLRISFHYSDQSHEVTISAHGSERVKSKQVTTFLHRLVQSRFGDELMALRDKGTVARCLFEDQYANDSTWHCSGLNIRFKDWRFIHRARLNAVPLNANKSRFSNTNPTCRPCAQHAETLPHVICYCHQHMVHIYGRHNAIVERLTNSIRFGQIITDRTITDSNI